MILNVFEKVPQFSVICISLFSFTEICFLKFNFN